MYTQINSSFYTAYWAYVL